MFGVRMDSICHMSNFETSRIWKIISQWLQPPSRDAAFWWDSTGSALAKMLSEAGYDQTAQLNALLFHYRHVIEAFGPRPSSASSQPRWRSFMTDDFSPLEYSWNWDAADHPKVRYSIEAIGTHAGSNVDPYNRSATFKIIDNLRQALPHTNWQWFNHFAEMLDAPDSSSLMTSGQNQDLLSSPSSIFLAFEFDEREIAMKAYFIPVKAKQSGESPFAIVDHAIQGLPGTTVSSDLRAHQQLQRFIQTSPLGKSLQMVGVSVDCVDPNISRLKYYVRLPSSSFQNVCTIMTLGRNTPGSKLSAGLEKLKHVWQLVLGLAENFAFDDELGA